MDLVETIYQMTIACFGLLLNIFHQFSVELLPLATNNKRFLLWLGSWYSCLPRNINRTDKISLTNTLFFPSIGTDMPEQIVVTKTRSRVYTVCHSSGILDMPVDSKIDFFKTLEV